MPVTLTDLEAAMASQEGGHLEFKEAKNHFDFEELVRYCARLANEGGGRLFLGVTDKIPRRVVGSRAFENLERTKHGLLDRLHLRIEAEVLEHPDGPVIVFDVPARPIGFPIQYKGAYWMRGGDSLVPMTQDMLQRVFAEVGPDFSAEICSGATLVDLDTAAVEEFRARWIRQSGNDSLARLSPEQLLADAELMDGRGVTYAALILLGTRSALGRFLAQAEVVFEYRATEAAGPANQRINFREGFLLFYDRLWETINLRNDQQHFQAGPFMLDVPTFSEGSVREAILNAVAHRAYRLAGSVFIRQYPRRIEVVSPGGLPEGITPENILYRQSPRNRRLAEAFEKCDLVERSGQGANRMFEEAIRFSKPLPDFTNTDAHQVSLTLRGEVQDPSFLRLLEDAGLTDLDVLSTTEWQVLDLLRRNLPIPPLLRSGVPGLLKVQLLEQAAVDWGRQAVKEIVLCRVEALGAAGIRLKDLLGSMPSLTRDQVQGVLSDLQKEGLVWRRGATRAARWFSSRIAVDSAEDKALEER